MYQQLISEALAKRGFIGKADPRHVEAYMRLEFGTLDALGGALWNRAVKEAFECVIADPGQAEQLAKSYGL